MDKFEYKVKADEIKELIAAQEYEQAAEIADTIDWRRVKSVMMLCTISDLYKMCRRYEDSRDMLLLAYERHPGGRTILYSLCELSIKMDELVQAVEYFKEYAQVAPKDTGRYVLQYKLYEAQDVSLEERIAVLEELKKKEYREKWAYELAYLYHRVGLATKCVEECDELFLWFGEGKYVTKALELKMLHAPLTPDQQSRYDNRFAVQNAGGGSAEKREQNSVAAGTLDGGSSDEGTVSMDTRMWSGAEVRSGTAHQSPVPGASTNRIPSEEIEIQVKTLDVGKYDTINLQEELAAGIQEYFENGGKVPGDVPATQESVKTSEEVPEEIPIEEMLAENDYAAEEAVENEPQSEVFFGETGELESGEQITFFADSNDMKEITVREEKKPDVTYSQPPKGMANVLSMEGDGQISFVLPENVPVEKQITGQISINDIILEWERLKKENQERHREEVRQRVLEQTGPMFTEFEAAVRDGLLEQLESGRQIEEENREKQLAELFEEQPAEAEEVDEQVHGEEAIDQVLTEEVAEEAAEEAADEQASAEEAAVQHEEQIEDMQEVQETEFVDDQDDIVFDEIPDEEEEDLGEAEELTEILEVTSEEESAEEMPEAEPAAEEAAMVERIEEEPAAEEKSAAETADKVSETEEAPAEKAPETVQTEKPHQKVRPLTREERELYGQYIQGRSSKEQIIRAVDSISMAAYTGNVIITGNEDMDTMGLAKNMVREVQMSDSNFSGKIAKISGETLNDRDPKKIVDDLAGGALIIQKAGRMKEKTADELYKALQQENKGIVIVMEDTRKNMDNFLSRNEKLLECFNARVDVAALSNDALVAFGRKYAREKEYSIDEFGILALHTRIEELQTSDHAVNVLEVKEIMDEAIAHVNRKTIGHFFDVLLSRRYDEEDMIILRERDFQ